MDAFRDVISVVRGFYASQARLGAGRIPDSIIAGLNVMIRGDGLIESSRPAGSTGLQGAAKSMLVGSTAGGIGSGSVVQGAGGGIYAVGSGEAFGAGATPFTAAAYLQFTRSNVLYTAGLNPPTAPSIATPSPADLTATKAAGSYSVKQTKYRSLTGIESNASAASNVVNTKASNNIHKALKVTQGSQSEVFDYLGTYVTRRNFGAVGIWYWFGDIPPGWNGSPAISGLTSTGVAGIYYLDINDSQLSFDKIPPVDHFYPPTGLFVFFLGNVAVIVGTYGGTGISPSIPGIYEAFVPSHTTFLPEPPLGIRGRATDGWVYILCRNSLNAAIFSGSAVTPIIPRTIYSDVGVANGSAAAMVGAGLYFFSDQRGACRTNGDNDEPDTTFAKPVQQYFADNSWGSSVVVGYDPANDAVVFCNGSTALAYHRSFDAWSTPLELGMTPVSAITYQGALHLSNGSTLFRFNAGTPGGGYSWYCIPEFRDAGAPEEYKTVISLQGAGSSSVQIDLLTNLDQATSKETTTLNGTHSDVKKTYIKDTRSYTTKFSGNAAGQRVDEMYIRGLLSRMRV